MTYFSSKNGSKKALKNCQKSDFFFVFLKKLAFGPRHPAKSDILGKCLLPPRSWWKTLIFELSPARQAQNAIFDFLKKSTCFMQQLSKIVLSPAPEAHFCCFASFEKKEKIITVFWKIAFYDVNMHIFAARGFQNGENEQLLGYYLCQDPKWVPKWSQNGPKRIQKGSKNLSKIWLFFFVFWKKLAFGPRHPSKSDILGTC